MSENFLFHTEHYVDVAPALVGPGRRYRLELGDRQRELFGFVPHLRYLRFQGRARVQMPTADDAPVQERQIPSILQQIRLESEGHVFCDGTLSGLDLDDDMLLRTGIYPQHVGPVDDGGDLPDGQGTWSFDLFWRFDNPVAPVQMRYDDCPPIRLFDHLKNSENVLEFTVAPNVGATEVQTMEEFRIVVGVVFLPEPRLPSPWQLRTHRTTEMESKFEPEGGIQYCVLRSRDVHGLPIDHSGYHGVTLTLGAEQIYARRTAEELVTAARAHRSWGHTRDDVAKSLEHPDGPQFLPIFLHAPDERRTKYPRGRLKIEFTARPTGASETRILYRETGVRSQVGFARWLRRIGWRPGATFVGTTQAMDGRGDNAADILPRAVLFSSATARSARERFFRKVSKARKG